MVQDNPRIILGIKIRNLRQERGLTLRETADRAGMSIAYLSEIEKGKKYPKPEKLLALAAALGVQFDELVSLQVRDELGPLKSMLGSPFLREFPFAVFGLEPEDVFSLVGSDPARAGALARTFVDIGQIYDVRMEQFLLAALRSYQRMHHNYFEDLEEEAASYRRELGLAPGDAPTADELGHELEDFYGYTIDFGTLATDPGLDGFRSVFDAGPPARLYVNQRLLPSQRAFVFGREIGYRRLDLEERAISSSWLEVQSFDQVLNNLKASYFSGALLLDRDSLERDLRSFLECPTWDGGVLLELMKRYRATPELFFTRLTQLLPGRLGLDEIYYMRFNHREGSDRYLLTKVLNMSRAPVPHGLGLNEHYCRRWPSMKLLAHPPRSADSPDHPAVLAQRSRFLGDDAEEAEFLVLSMVRPLALTGSVQSSVSLGFYVNRALRRTVRFWDDPEIPRVDVNLTCERCPLSREECAERVVDPVLHRQREDQRRRQAALAALLSR